MPRKSRQRNFHTERPAQAQRSHTASIAPPNHSLRIALLCVLLALAAVFAIHGLRTSHFLTQANPGGLLQHRQEFIMRSMACAFTAFHAAHWDLVTWTSGYSIEKVLWILRLLGLLALLVVLCVRRHARRFPWFTASIALAAPYMVAERFLSWRFPVVVMAWTLVLSENLIALCRAIVVLELGQRVFERVRMKTRFVWMLVLLGVGLGLMTFWGPRPTEQMLGLNSQVAVLQFLRVVDLNCYLLGDIMATGLGLLVFVFGRRYKGSWRSHSVQIVFGLAVASITQMSLVGGWQALVGWALSSGSMEYDRLMTLQTVMFNIASGIYIAVLIWWTVSLWTGAPDERQRRRRRRSWQTAPATTGEKAVAAPAQERQ